MFTRHTYKNEQEWLKGRINGIGGSDAAAIVGLNPYKTNIQLWEEKTGKRTPEDISEKECVIYGKNAEELLRQLFIMDYPQYQVSHREYEILQSKKYPYLLASLDGELLETETSRKGILEIKTTSILQSMQWEKWNDRIPDNYYIQVLHYLLVTGYEFIKLKAQMVSEWDNEKRITTRHYQIERNEVLEDLEYLLENETKFWEQYVLKDEKPPLILPAI